MHVGFFLGGGRESEETPHVFCAFLGLERSFVVHLLCRSPSHPRIGSVTPPLKVACPGKNGAFFGGRRFLANSLCAFSGEGENRGLAR